MAVKKCLMKLFSDVGRLVLIGLVLEREFESLSIEKEKVGYVKVC